MRKQRENCVHIWQFKFNRPVSMDLLSQQERIGRIRRVGILKILPKSTFSVLYKTAQKKNKDKELKQIIL